MKKILWLIPARSGSKSIIHKNIKLLGKYPLISYRIKSAKSSQFSNDIWVSTDSEEYASIAIKYDAIIPFIRPSYLASDEASSIDVVLHAMDFANKKNLKYEYIGLLEPTSPFISAIDLDNSINLLDNNTNADCVVAVRESRPNKIFIQKKDKYLKELAENIKTLKKLGRQSFEKEITPSGGIYISRWESFIENKSFYTEKTLGYEVNEISGLEIDEPIDWDFAEFIINKSYENK